MILVDEEKWKPPGRSKSPSHYLVVDDTDSSNKKIISVDKKSCHLNIGSLLTSLHNEPSQISLLSGSELEKLSDMDPESLGDIVADRFDDFLSLFFCNFPSGKLCNCNLRPWPLIYLEIKFNYAKCH